jgi:membrane-bound lytic murein transglycosylase D
MLFSLSIMSFRYGSGTVSSKNAVTNASDSINSSNNAFSTLLSNPVANNKVAIQGVFKLNPAMTSFIKGYKKRETEEYGDMKVWGKNYLQLMDEILAQNGLPIELKYLSVIESNLQAGTVSSSGATGPWQLMADEGRMFGLTMRKKNDERKDFEKSTEVAASLLKNLYSQFGDWLLVIAAYNCGCGGMRKAINKAGSKNYWKLEKYLPEQTRTHVKKYIATHYIFEGGGGWTTVTNDEALEYSAAIAKLDAQNINDASAKTATIAISGKYNSAVLSNDLMIDKSLFSQLNPGIDKALLDGKTYELTLPADKMPLFQANRQQILEQSVQLFVTSAYNR